MLSMCTHGDVAPSADDKLAEHDDGRAAEFRRAKGIPNRKTLDMTQNVKPANGHVRQNGVPRCIRTTRSIRRPGAIVATQILHSNEKQKKLTEVRRNIDPA